MSARSLPRSARTALVALALSSVPLLAAGCSDGPECVIDTDCQLGYRCGGGGTCVRIGERQDAGATEVDAGVADAGADAGMDAATDAGEPDAGSDAGPACVDLREGVYRVTAAAETCGVELDATVRVIEASTGECSRYFESLGSPVANGEIVVDETGAFVSTVLVVGTLGAVDARGQYDPETSVVRLDVPASECEILLEQVE